jgi:hypothetical protein
MATAEATKTGESWRGRPADEEGADDDVPLVAAREDGIARSADQSAANSLPERSSRELSGGQNSLLVTGQGRIGSSSRVSQLARSCR